MKPEDPRPVVLGRIAGVYGIKGWVKLISYTRPPEAILKYRNWLIETPGSPAYSSRMVDGRVHGQGLVAQFCYADGSVMQDRDFAAELVGALLSVPRSELPPAEPGLVYWADLIGMTVKSLQDETLGVVEGVTDNGAHDVLVVRDESVKDSEGRALERLIPFVRGPIIHSTSLEDRLVIADWRPDY